MARRLVCGRRAGGEESRSQLLAEPRRLQCDTHSRVRGGGKASPGDWGPERQTPEGWIPREDTKHALGVGINQETEADGDIGARELRAGARDRET